MIEDEPEIAELACEMLADEGYNVILAHDGFEALKIYEQDRASKSVWSSSISFSR